MNNQHNLEFVNRLSRDPRLQGPISLELGRFAPVEVAVFLKKSLSTILDKRLCPCIELRSATIQNRSQSFHSMGTSISTTSHHAIMALDAKTADAFATSWNHLPEGSIYTRDQFEDWMAPITEKDVAGNRVLELGCGNASLMVHVTEWLPSYLRASIWAILCCPQRKT